MNHDATHCVDYRKSYCPERCYRARLTQELLEFQAAGKLSGPVSYAKFYGTPECIRKRRDKT